MTKVWLPSEATEAQSRQMPCIPGPGMAESLLGLLQRVLLASKGFSPAQEHRALAPGSQAKAEQVIWLMCGTEQGHRGSPLPHIFHMRTGTRNEAQAGGRRQDHHMTGCSDRCWGRGGNPEDQHRPP